MNDDFNPYVSSEEADLIALAIDFYIGQIEMSEKQEKLMENLLLRFDYFADPDSFLQYAHSQEYSETMAITNRASDCVEAKEGNLIRVDFSKE